MTEHNKLVRYAHQAIKAYSDVMAYDTPSPQVMATVGETDYCGKMISWTLDGSILRSVMVLNLESIKESAINDNVSIEQMTLETLYHEWIHFIHSIEFPDSDDLRGTHSGDMWDCLIDIGLDNGFIHRRNI